MGVMNHKRAAWARKAVDAFAAETGQNPKHELQECIKDLMCNLQHLANQSSMDPVGLMESAGDNYQGEIMDDE